MARRRTKVGQAAGRVPRWNVVPDRLDLRDRLYLPAIASTPPPRMEPRVALPVLDQGSTSACTGFALSNVVNHLLRRQDPSAAHVSPFMLYSMARRYDEFPGSTADTGSSLRGVLKGWYKHGVCEQRLWRREPMPLPAARPEDDWWQDAARRPMGAYYRVEARSVADLHVALHETGIVVASAVCHAGWDQGFKAPKGRAPTWRIPARKGTLADGGHAFAIVGYDDHGFLVHNSWGKGWGTGGLGVLAYEDWLDNAMDAWVAQLGVVTDLHLAIAASLSLRRKGRRVQIASDPVLRDREIGPFVIDMENDGRLSNTGEFRTQEGDLTALVTTHAGAARSAFGLAEDKPMDVALYAHGGLVGEKVAAKTAAEWIPALYDAAVFPIFLMWETDLWSTLKHMLSEAVAGVARPTGGWGVELARWWNERLERALAVPGSAVWDEMKENAERLSGGKQSGGRLLYAKAHAAPLFQPGRVRLHLIGHSAGSIVHAHLIDRLCRAGWAFESVTFLAPAVRVDTFEELVLPHLRSGKVSRYRQLHLSDAAEQADDTCKAILGYSRSLLYLAAHSFEGGQRTEILGLEKDFAEASKRWGLANVEGFSAGAPRSDARTHGDLDDDPATRAWVIRGLKTP